MFGFNTSRGTRRFVTIETKIKDGGRLLFLYLALSGLAMVMLAILPGCSEQKWGKEGAKPLTVFGNVDIREVQLAFQDGGRLLRLVVDEGDRVRQGELVAELDPTRFQLEVQRLSGEVRAQAKVLERLHHGSRPQEIGQASAGVASAVARLNEAELLLARKQSLLVTNGISRQEVDSAVAGVKVLRAALNMAEEELSLVMEGPRKEDIAAATATLDALQIARELAQQRLTDTRLLAPADGIIRNRILEPGAMVVAGTPVLTLALTDPLWARVYISEPDLGRIREGMAAELRTDTYPDRIYRGWVGFISSTAEFTPKTVETTELRTKLVYRARVMVCDPQHDLRLGMPVTVTIATSPDGLQAGGMPECD